MALLKARVTHTTGYKMLRDAGFEFVKFSEQPTRHGRKTYDTRGYWKHLPEFVSGTLGKVPRDRERPWVDWGEPQADGIPSTVFTRHAKARIEYLAVKREAESIDNLIATLREMAAPVLELTEPPATDWQAVREAAMP